MYLIGPDNTRIWSDTNRNFTLRQYGRMEYGNQDVSWILASVPSRRSPKPTRRPRLGLRLRYFLNSFRGFAALDVKGHDDTKSI